MDLEVLVFEIEGRRFGIQSCAVVEVVRAVKLSPSPERLAMLEGLLNLRGKIVPVLNLREILGLASRAIKHTDHFIVVRLDDRVVTIRVDRAVDLVRLEDSDVEPAKEIARAISLIERMGKTDDGIVHVLDVRRLFSMDDKKWAGVGAAAPSESTS